MKVYTPADEQLKSDIQKDFGISTVDLEGVTNGDYSDVYSAIVGGQKVFIRINDNVKIFPIETAVLKLVAAHGIPCPTVLQYAVKPAHIGRPTMVQTAASGQALGRLDLPSAEQETAYQAMGQSLKKIHGIALAGFGTLKMAKNSVQGKFGSWKEFWLSQDYPNNFNYIREHKFIDDRQYQRLKEVFQQIGEIEVPQALLNHGDYHPWHVFIEKNKVVCIIDWNSSFAGDSRMDLAEALFHLSPDQAKAFKHGYGPEANDPIIKKYLQMVVAWKVTYRHKNNYQDRMSHALRVLNEVLS